MARGDYETLTPEAIDQLCLRLRAGQAAKPTARELRLSPSTVRTNLLRCDGIRPGPRRRGADRLRLEEIEEISRGLAAGRSYPETAKAWTGLDVDLASARVRQGDGENRQP